MGVKNVEELKPQTVTLVNEVEEEEDDEIDLGALFYRFLEKIHWIIICAVIASAFGATFFPVRKEDEYAA